MKRLLAAVALLGTVSSSLGAGPIDGIYSCGVNAAGSASNVYISINGQGATSIFVVAAVAPSTSFYGYGIGTATSTSFNGTTMFGQPFNFALGPNGTFSGTIRILLGNTPVNASANCVKIF